MSPTTILITWSPPPISMHNGVLTGYVIRATDIDSQMVIQLTLGSSVNNYTIPSLNPFSNYLCTVATKTSAGLGPYSPGEVIQTLQSGMYMYVLNSSYIINTSTMTACYLCRDGSHHGH